MWNWPRWRARGSLINFESIAGEAFINFLGEAIDTAVDAVCLVQSVAPEPCAVVEDVSALMVEEDDFLALILFGEEGGLDLLGHEFRRGESNGFKFFSSAGIEEGEGLVALEEGGEFLRRDEHGEIMFLAFKEALYGFGDVDLVVLADFLEGVAEVISA